MHDTLGCNRLQSGAENAVCIMLLRRVRGWIEPIIKMITLVALLLLRVYCFYIN